MTPCRLLFVTWDGPQVSYLESLYMPLFARLAGRGCAVHVLQFTWADAARRDAIRAACEAGGATYRSVPVLRRPVSAGSLATAVLGAAAVRREVDRHGIDVVMPRSTLPALATRLALRNRPGVRIVFDADGLPHDERVDFEGWSPQGFAYRLLRDLEAAAVCRADSVITRSRSAVDILAARAGPGIAADRFVVAGNGRDPALFRPLDDDARAAVRRELGVPPDAPLLVYAGSLGTQYCLPAMLSLFDRVRRRRDDARLLLLTGSPELAERGFDGQASLRETAIVRCAAPEDVPHLLAAGDLGLALRQPSFSMQAVAPIKLGEYLLCGLPVVATDGIGDSAALVPADVGRLLESMDEAALDATAAWFVRDVLGDAAGFRTRCRKWGLRHFDAAAMTDAFERAIAQARAAR